MAILMSQSSEGRTSRPHLVRLCVGRGVSVSTFCLIMAGATLIPIRTFQAEAEKGSSEYELKAAFLYNFAKFVEWPVGAFSDQGAPIVVGVVGDDPFNGSLDSVVGKSANGRQVAIRRLSASQDLRSCHMLFVSSSERKRLGEIVASVDGASVLTVGEMEGFASNGGMITLTMEDNKVRFEINAGMARRARLKISSKLLSLAKRVID